MSAVQTAKAAKKPGTGFRGIQQGSFLVILVCLIIAVCVFHFVFGNPANFEGGNPENHPLQGNLLGTIYKGGFVVPIIQCLLLTVIAFSIERFFAIGSATGKGSLSKFAINVKQKLDNNDIDGAEALAMKQKGSVSNVMLAALKVYRQMETNTEMNKEQKLLAIQKELDEATALELPMLQKNLPIIATITTLGTLLGLLGTVLGMIKSFAALGAGSGSVDSAALSVGISEALVNTASGIATGALAVIFYNYFTNRIDQLTYCIDEIGFSIVGTYAANHK